MCTGAVGVALSAKLGVADGIAQNDHLMELLVTRKVNKGGYAKFFYLLSFIFTRRERDH